MVKKKEVKVFIEPPDISDISSDSSDEELVQPHVIEETKEQEPEVTPKPKKVDGRKRPRSQGDCSLRRIFLSM